jgi:hypothetical protein
MARHPPSFRFVTTVVIVAFAATQFYVRPALAVMVATEAVANASQRSVGRDRVREFLAREDVRVQLERLGVSPKEAMVRVSSLSDAEIARINTALDALPAGGDFIGLVAGVFLVLVVFLIITELLGWTDVFSFLGPLPRGSAD